MIENARLRHLQNSDIAKARYHQALDIFYDLQIEVILLELGAAQQLPLNDPKVGEKAMFDRFEMEGWEKCRRMFFNLLEEKLADAT